jgi:hypothetical protein
MYSPEQKGARQGAGTDRVLDMILRGEPPKNAHRIHKPYQTIFGIPDSDMVHIADIMITRGDEPTQFSTRIFNALKRRGWFDKDADQLPLTAILALTPNQLRRKMGQHPHHDKEQGFGKKGVKAVEQTLTRIINSLPR